MVNIQVFERKMKQNYYIGGSIIAGALCIVGLLARSMAIGALGISLTAVLFLAPNVRYSESYGRLIPAIWGIGDAVTVLSAIALQNRIPGAAYALTGGEIVCMVCFLAVLDLKRRCKTDLRWSPFFIGLSLPLAIGGMMVHGESIATFFTVVGIASLYLMTEANERLLETLKKQSG